MRYLLLLFLFIALGCEAQVKGVFRLPPQNTVAPVVSGATVNIGDVVSTTNGTWSPAATSYTYQWYRGTTLIGGATSSTYTVTWQDNATSLSCSVTAYLNGSTSPTVSSSNSLSSYSIASITNTEAWYDANNAANTLSGSVVQVLKDKSSHLRDMNTTDGTGFPTYVSSGGSNNLGYISFPGTNAIYSSSFTNVNSPFSVYLVLKQVALTDATTIYQTGPSNQWTGQNTTTSGIAIQYHTGSTYGFTTNGAILQWELMTNRIDNPVGAFLQINNEAYAQGHYAATQQGGVTNNFISQIGFFKSGSNTMSNFQVSEMLIVSGTITSADDKNIRKYLTGKYAITEKKSAVYFGDSITTGALADDVIAHGYVTLSAQAKGYDYINWSYPGSNVYPHSGSNGAAGENLIDSYTRVSGQNTDWLNSRFFFAYGTNDATKDAAWVTQYKAIVQVFITAGVPAGNITIVGQPNGSFAAISQVASDLGCNYFDTNAYFVAHGGVSANMNVDGLHPNTLGHSNMSTGLQTYLP